VTLLVPVTLTRSRPQRPHQPCVAVPRGRHRLGRGGARESAAPSGDERAPV